MNAGAARASTSSGLQNHFELFGLPPSYGMDEEILEKAYREIQARVHPDRFAHAGDAERRASLQWTTRVNDVAFETNTQMPTDFLMQQLELREELEAATGGKDSSRLDGLRSRLRLQETKLESEIAEAIDGKKDYAGAAELVKKLMFLERLDAEIDSAYETIEQ